MVISITGHWSLFLIQISTLLFIYKSNHHKTAIVHIDVNRFPDLFVLQNLN